jgi:hypothetical protein
MDCEDEVSMKGLWRAGERLSPEGVVVPLYAHRLWRSAHHPLCDYAAAYEYAPVAGEGEMPAAAQPAPIKEPGFWLPALIALISCASIIGIYWGLLAMIKAVVRFPA